MLTNLLKYKDYHARIAFDPSADAFSLITISRLRQEFLMMMFFGSMCSFQIIRLKSLSRVRTGGRLAPFL